MKRDNSKKIKVICGDRMCFDVDSKTFEPICCTYYDPYPRVEDGYFEIISHHEYLIKRDQCCIHSFV